MSFRVFLLEDSHDTAETVQAYLRLRGIDTFWSASLYQARGSYDPGLFDVLLVDYELPDGTGIDFLAEIDRDDQHAILWSGLDRSRELAKAGLDGVTHENKARMDEVLGRIVAMRDKAES